MCPSVILKIGCPPLKVHVHACSRTRHKFFIYYNKNQSEGLRAMIERGIAVWFLAQIC